MRRPHAQGAARRSVTLVELLVVMGIMAILAGMVALGYTGISRRRAREGAAEKVLGTVRAARISAVDSGRGAVLQVTQGISGGLAGVASEVVAAWHFEETNAGVTPGARRMDAMLWDDPQIAQGALGLCLQFDASDDQDDDADGIPGNDGADYLDCGNYPVYGQTEGIRLEAWVRPHRDGAADQGIIAKTNGANRGYFLGVDTQNFFWADAGFGTQSGGIYLASYNTDEMSGVSFPAAEWVHLAAEFDGYEARLFVNGIRVMSLDHLGNRRGDGKALLLDSGGVPIAPPAFGAGALMEPAPDEPLHIGHRWDPAAGQNVYFRGLVDEPRVLSVAGGESHTVPERVPLVASDSVIHFGGEGQLDLAYHSGPVYVAVGDPYQSAPFSSLVGPVLTLDLGGAPNPFPTGGGYVLIMDPQKPPADWELLRYTDLNATQLTGVSGDQLGIGGPGGYSADSLVMFARIVKVGITGVITRVDRNG